jgi:hypothetical protein
MRHVIKEYNVYSFNELSDKAKQRARNWYSEGLEFNDEFVLEDAKEVAKLMGINISSVQYSGFSSQGDGLCFIGKYSPVEKMARKVKEYAPLDQKLQDIALLLELSRPLTAVIERKYYNSFNMEITCYNGDDEKHSKEVELLETALNSFATWIYRSLEKEYEYQNSNEAIDETILANEYEFLENGDRA